MTRASKIGRPPLITLRVRRKHASGESPLTAELKGFIDRVIAPILVQSFLVDVQSEKEVAETTATMASCGLMPDTSQAGVSR
jgi:hypothetical protein